MPKNTRSGTSYDGHFDVTPAGVTPEWVPASEVSRETSPSPTVGEPVDTPRGPGRPKGSKNKPKDAVAGAQAAEGAGAARA